VDPEQSAPAGTTALLLGSRQRGECGRPGHDCHPEEVSWSIGVGSQLVIDVGQNQETVTVTGVSMAPTQFTATFARPHPIGCAISNATLGNPGPQPFFDLRNPQHAGVVRYFSIIQ
jgi:hypothetical protein